MKSNLEHDPIVASLLPQFLKNLAVTTAKLTQAHGDRDAKSLVRLAHTIKGSSICYGYDQISAVAGLLEIAGGSNFEDQELVHLVSRLKLLVGQAIETQSQFPASSE